MSTATFILSTGRCGTQWLCKMLGDHYADAAVVTHEPHKREYFPRRLLGIDDPAQWPSITLIDRHVARIETHLQSKRYVECGWPCYGPLPYFAKRFSGRIRVVHLVRHPVETAASMLTHLYYHESRPYLAKKALLIPTDPGVALPEYRDRWPSMSRFEKCLYFWAEVNLLGLRLETQLGVPWLRIRSKDMFGGPAFDELVDFIGLPHRQSMREAGREPVDKYSQGTNVSLRAELATIQQHPRIQAVARELGFDPLSFDADRLCRRYQFVASSTDPNAKLWLPQWIGVPRNARCPCGSGRRYKQCHGTLD